MRSAALPDSRALKFFVSYEARFGQGPSLTDIVETFGFKSKTSAVQLVRRLERRGLIRRSGIPLPHTHVRSIQTIGGHR